ncbi:MAG: DUF1801 domain-containing protein [Verrucomicrobia bacterium]|nr:DUF1801 domain-containing protein [Verrucomicrobiota bacterium]
MIEINNSQVAEIFAEYPELMREKILFLRQIIFETAAEIEDVVADGLEEVLKWENPSYLTEKGSTIRLGLRKSNPKQYAMYFHCGTKLVDTFRNLYRDQFIFEGNRAIFFNENDKVPIKELKHCIVLALTYHKIKTLPMLGA